MPKFKKNPEELNDLCKAMNEKISGARSDDSGSLRDDALNYLIWDTDERLNPPIAKKMPKSGTRGFNHPQLGYLLCPRTRGSSSEMMFMTTSS